MRLMTPPTYYKYSELEKDFAFFEKGKYIETTENPRFGNLQHLFEDLDTGERKCLNGAGQLNYMVDQLSEGDVCKIVFKGKITLDKGKMAGKEANQFDVFVDESAPKVKVEAKTEDLDGLE